MSQFEEDFILMLKFSKDAIGLPLPVREYRFDKKRKWRFDFAWPKKKIAVECEGAIWTGRGRHSFGAGFIADTQKYNAAALQGWKVLRYTTETMSEAIGDLKKIGF